MTEAEHKADFELTKLAHSSTSQVGYGMSLVHILEKNHSIIMVLPHYFTKL